ncbi:MAG: electron transfer flavoprotein subunit beta/FixA family protein [Nitrososphaerales archaeon]|nr:electron transfer flavoprotein subunit beta/FixA family protein [Nitrososphaerales archaeon]
MKSIVCVKVTPKVEQIKFDEARKTVTREGVENEINDADKNALEMALQLKERHGGTVVVLSMGPPSFESHLKLAIAMGADDAILLSDRSFGGADTYATSRVLAAAIKRMAPYDVVLCGEASADGSTEQTPPSIAEWLQVPGIMYANSIELQGNRVLAKKSIAGGYETVEAETPLLASVELGCNSPRFPDFRRKRWAEKEFKLTVWNMQDLGFSPTEVGLGGSLTEVKELRNMSSRKRRGELIGGDSKEVAARLGQIIRSVGG